MPLLSTPPAAAATEQKILSKPLDFTEEAALESLGKNQSYRFSRCSRHGLYAYNYMHVANECPFSGCTSQVVAIADVAAFAEQNGVAL